MLAEWLSKGNGLFKTHNGQVRNYIQFAEDHAGSTVELNDYKIRWFGTDMWLDPTVGNIKERPAPLAKSLDEADAMALIYNSYSKGPGKNEYRINTEESNTAREKATSPESKKPLPDMDALTYAGQLPTGKDGDVIEFADGTSGIIKCLGSNTPPENACRVPTDEDGSPRLAVKERYDFVKNTTGIDYDDDIELTTHELLEYCKYHGLYKNTIPTLPPHSKFFTMKNLVKSLMCNPMMRLVAYLDNTEYTYTLTTIGTEGKHLTILLSNDYLLDVYHDYKESNTDFRVVKNVHGHDSLGDMVSKSTEEHWDLDDLLEYIGINAE
jgi:hypothetical protein